MSSRDESSSSGSEFIREQLEITKSISGKGLDHSSILECLQQKVQELNRFREENIALQSQLKIARETCKLQEADFAFQRTEYEAEITHLHQIEDEMRKKLSKYEGMHDSFDDSQGNSPIIIIKSKYEKWKQKAHEVKTELQLKIEENQELKKKLKKTKGKKGNTYQSPKSKSNSQEIGQSEQNQIIDQLNDQLSQLSTQKKNSDNDCAKLQKEVKTLTNENNEMKSQIDQFKSQIKANESQFKDAANESIEKNNKNYSKKIQTLEQDNLQLQVKLAHQVKKTKKLNKLQEQVHQDQLLFDHIENERSSIADILGVELEDVKQPWTNLVDKTEQIMLELSSINTLKANNERLQKRIDALSKIKLPAENSSRNETKEQDDLVFSSLQKSLCQAQNELEDKREQVMNYQYRNKFAYKIQELYHLLSKQIEDVHGALFSPAPTMRRIILAVVFTKRFMSLSKREKSHDIRELSAFQGRIYCAPSTKLAEIKSKITEITQDLLTAKQSVMIFDKQAREAIRERDASSVQLQTNSDEVNLSRQKLHFLKERMIELQEELAALVDPTTYNDLQHNFHELQWANEKLHKRIAKLKEIIIEKENEIKSKEEEKAQLQIFVDQKTENTEEIQRLYEEKENEIEYLKTLLKEKTKEIFSLERCVNRHVDKSNSINSSFANVSSENQNLHQRIANTKETEFQPHINVTLGNNDGIASFINPAFLQ